MEAIKINKQCCRLCDGDITETDQRHCIFEKNSNGQQLINLIKECLPLIIYRTDPLSKQICETCYKKLCSLYEFKKTSINTANKYVKQFKNNADNASKDIKLYLACDAPDEKHHHNIPILCKDAGTFTDDLTITCLNCKSSSFDTNLMNNNEVELCAELHKAIADSLSNNKVLTTDDDTEKVLRSRRRRSQAFYHELDDSLCSSLTEFTNTESSQFFEEYGSDMESYESDDGNAEHKAKRRKIEHNETSIFINDTITNNNNSSSSNNIDNNYENNDMNCIEKLKMIFENEIEYRYNPLSLLKLTLNVINEKIVPDYQPEETFLQEIIEPYCIYCKDKFKNSKLLALHEIKHINIAIGDKVDNSILWDDTQECADIRNKWLNTFENIAEDHVDYDDNSAECIENENQSLLIPIGSEDLQQNGNNDDMDNDNETPAYEILFERSKPVVNGVPLSQYSKEERKTFYKTVRIGGVNKKFCTMCRYSFKDNWAIESHYFSSACYYTCRYCGMRFNKQRHRFDEHVIEHEERGDLLTTQVYAACKNNNVIPRIIPTDKCDDIPPPIQIINEKLSTDGTLFYKNQYNIRIKDEPLDSPPLLPPPSRSTRYNLKQNSPTTTGQKTTNQAYFCRKCYKVFFKLDEFNVHSKNCDFNQFPARNCNNNRKYGNVNGDVTTATTTSGRSTKNYYNNDEYNNKESQQHQSFICFICNTSFPTIYSRNSHMRIHKGETPGGDDHSPSTSQHFYKPKQLDPTNEIRIKQEPLEPEIQIHESEQNYHNNNNSNGNCNNNSNKNSNIGAVSITPISKNPNQKATINPNIMKLVQNNPHLTIKANVNQTTSPSSQEQQQQLESSITNLQNNYKCSNCWESFKNKSHLYFHKKNKCEGSKYPCPFCKKRFGTESAYSSHIFYSHPE